MQGLITDIVRRMGIKKSCCLLVLLVLVAHINANDVFNKIKHVIVLMEENRSFDHMFGWYPGVNGLKGDECNLVNSSQPAKATNSVCVNKVSPLVAPCDPDHGTPATSFKIFGAAEFASNKLVNPTMSGFVEWEDRRGNKKTNYCDVMAMLTPNHVPIITSLASEFAVFDRFFASHPGPTWPNRLFYHSATSAGDTETGTWFNNTLGQFFPQPTFSDQVMKEGLTWRHYYNDTPWEVFITSFAHNPENLVSMEQFYEDARTGNLPSYAFINPRSGFNLTLMQGSNDQHPDHDVALGELFMKDVYEALRASPQWNETLFVITYDEHGGYYDHVAPPMKDIPPPGDGYKSYPDKFSFDRLGVRIPTLLISPWIPKGLVLTHPPAAQKPANSSEYSLTSIMATARKLLGMKSGPLTNRDKWSATFEQVFNLTQPRQDCPQHLPPAPPPSSNYDPKIEYLMPVNDLQKQIMTWHAELNGVEFPHHITQQGQVSEWLQHQFDAHKERTIQWKKSKELNADASSYLVLRLPRATTWVSQAWNINKPTKVPYKTLSLKTATPLCLDAGAGKEGSQVTVSNCYPSAAPDTNRDDAQHWIWGQDSTIRPYTNQSLCLNGAILEKDEKVYLRACKETAEQHWAFHGDNDGDYLGGGIVFSEWTLGIVDKAL